LSSEEERYRNEREFEKLWRRSQRRTAEPRDDNLLGIILAFGDMNEDINTLRKYLDFIRVRPTEFTRSPYWDERGSPEQRLQLLESEVKDLKQRIEVIESTNKGAYLDSNWFEIVAEVITLYSQLPYIVAVYCKKAEGVCDLLFVHDSDDPSSAQKEIFDRTLVLERRFSKADFDYLILRKDETNVSDLATLMLLYSRR
jgi:hypothetical protein